MNLNDHTQATISLINNFYKKQQADSRRDHLGASLIGEDCERKLWYTFRWALNKKHEGRMIRLFEDGNKFEDEIIKDLRKIGIKVWSVDPKTKEQWRFLEHFGHFGGSLDGIGKGFPESSKKPHVLEFKTANDNSFKDMEKNGVQKSKPMHYAQMQVYMHLSHKYSPHGIERAFYIMKNKNNSKLYSERIKYNSGFAQHLLDKAERIIFNDHAPDQISNMPSFTYGKFQGCKYCDFKGVCHFGDIPEPTCRACAHSEPCKSGTTQWICRHPKYPDMALDREHQLLGCDHHVYNPHMLPDNPVEIHEKGEWIKYQDYINGYDYIKSKELFACKGDLSVIKSPAVQKIKGVFPNSTVVEVEQI